MTETSTDKPQSRSAFSRAAQGAGDVALAAGFAVVFTGAAIADLARIGFDAAREKISGKKAPERTLYVVRVMGAPD